MSCSRPGFASPSCRSHDQRVELFGQFDLGLGTSVNEQSPAPRAQPTINFRLYYDIGPGVRFWAHPQFAVGAVAGVHGDFACDQDAPTRGTNVSDRTSSTVTAIFASLQLMGVF